MHNGPKFPGERSRKHFGGNQDFISKSDVLYRLFGELVEEIKYAFLHLDDDKLAQVLNSYKKTYGDKAFIYAKKTYLDWRNKHVQLSGQTMERLLCQVPAYLSDSVRISVLTKLVRQTNFSVRTDKVIIDLSKPRSGINKLQAYIQYLSSNKVIEAYPSNLREAALWLNDRNEEKAYTMLFQIDNEIYGAARKSACDKITNLLAEIKQGKAKNPSYTINYSSMIINVIIIAGVTNSPERVVHKPAPNEDDKYLTSAWVFVVIGAIAGFCILLIHRFIKNG